MILDKNNNDFPTVADTVGNTPLVMLQRLPVANNNRILLKLEGNNPAGSVKDRPAMNMIVQAGKRGDIKPGDTLIEATSGNTGIALAMAAAVMGYRMVLIMPDNMTEERRAAMKAYGAEIIRCRNLEVVSFDQRGISGESGSLFQGWKSMKNSFTA